MINIRFGSLVCTSLLVLSSYSGAITKGDSSETQYKLRAIANAVLKDATFRFADRRTGELFVSPEQAPAGTQIRLVSPYTDWRYWNGVLNIAMMKLGEVLEEPAFIRFPVKNVAFSFDHYRYFERMYKNEGKWNYPMGQRFIMEELDDCGAMGASVIEVFRLDPQQRYRDYIDQAADHMLRRQSRMDDGTFVRSFPHRWTLWADDLYMSLSFMARMGELSRDERYFDDAAQQVVNFHKYVFDETRGIMHHCWYSDVSRPGVAFWGRANGWALVAQIDLLDRLPENHPKRKTLIALLQRHILGIARYQGPDGLWHQLLDKPDSYLETSCSAMFTYSIARAVNKGYIEPRYASIARRGWEGVMSRIQADGTIDGICAGTVTSDDLVYYYHRPTPHNDVHGIGTVLLAGAEMLKLKE